MNIAEESPISQPGKKLEKSLDAIAALRKAMEERMAEARAVQERTEAQAKAVRMLAEREAEEEKADAAVAAAEERADADIKAAQEKAESDVRAAQERADAEARAVREKADAEARAAQELAESEAHAARAKAEAETRAAQERALAEAKAAHEKAESEARAAQEMADAEAKAAEEKAENEAKAARDIAEAQEREAQEKADAEARAAQERADAEKREAQERAESQAREAQERAESEAKAAQEKAEAEAREAQIKADLEAKALREKAEAEAAEAQAKAEREAREARRKAKAEAEAAREKAEAEMRAAQALKDAEPLTDIRFDLVEWTQIMVHVAEECQKKIRDYIVRTRDKPMDTLSISPNPMIDSISRLTSRFLEDPEAYTDAQLATWQNFIDLTRATMLRLQGFSAEPVAEAAPNDKRFKAKDWQTNWMFDFLKQAYLSTTDEARRLVQMEASNVETKMAKKIEFYSRLFLDATAPNNFWMTNPEVLRATLDSRGENLIKGFENLLRDIESGNGLLRIRMSDYSAFELGKNIATTPGKVVFQNDLFQLIQFSPSTETVRQTPFLIIPPWINKYYILDLRERNSFIKYLIDQGHTVFCISWVNPTKRHALTQFEDYLETGALTAMREIKQRTGEDEINVLGYCIGGTLLSCAQAYVAALPEKPADLPAIKSATYLVSMIDFAQPGDLGVFIDEDQIRLLEDRMARLGYMDGNSLMMTFNLLRSNDLIWPFVINNYLLGREPFPFDILYWNTDSTNLPAAMQSYYLRRMYLENKLVEPNALKMKGVPLDLGKITTPSFLLSTREDHIAPWRSTYSATHLYKGPVTFVLSGSGHIAGVINPPDAHKYGYWVNDKIADDPDEWLKSATSHKGSWWPEWIKWLDAFGGANVPAREVEDGIEDAPGSYVKVRAI